MTIIRKRQAINGFGLAECSYAPKLKQPRHTHLLASFSFVLAGGYTEDYGSQSLPRRASTVVFHPPYESHAVDFENGARILNVEISDERLAYIRERSICFSEPASRRTEKIARLGREIYREFRRPDSVSALAIEGLIFQILAESARVKISSQEKKSPRWLKQTRDFLHDNFSESITVETLARIADVHPAHLARVFRREFDCTIGEYVRRLRVEFARRQISTTDTPLCEIALAAGFADQSHLNKTFKNLLGATPLEYKKRERQMLA